MNPFATRISGNQWVIPVSVMGLVLGLIMGLAKLTQERLRMYGDPEQQNRVKNAWIDIREEYTRVSNEVERLRKENTRLQNAISNNTNQAQVLNESLQQVKGFAGLTEMQGPGLLVTLQDSSRVAMDGTSPGDKIIHDVDVLKVCNELWAAGADGISVNGHRIVGKSSFRCVGPVIHVDNVPISSPVKIRAVGDPDTLRGAMSLPLGVLAEIRSTGDPSMVSIATVDKQVLPAYNGSTERRVGKAPSAKDKS